MSLIITRETHGSFYGNDYVIGSTVSSFLLPIINLRYKSNISDIESIYHKPITGVRRAIPIKFKLADFLDNLNMCLNLTSYIIGKDENDNDLVINVGKGYITDKDDNILLVLGLTDKGNSSFESQSRYYGDRFYSPPIQELPQHPHLCMLISTELITNKTYALFYKKLEKDYIADAYQSNIEVRFITSQKIEKLTYSNEFELRFNTIEQLQSHLQNSVPKLMFLTDSDYQNGVNPGLNCSLNERNPVYVPPVQETESIFPIDELRDMLSSLSSQRTISLIDDYEDPPF